MRGASCTASSCEQREALSWCRQAVALVGERRNPMARGVLVIMLAEFGGACRAVGDLPGRRLAAGPCGSFGDLGWPDLLGGGAGLEQAGPPSRQR
jgi:hypothetical protein